MLSNPEDIGSMIFKKSLARLRNRIESADEGITTVYDESATDNDLEIRSFLKGLGATTERELFSEVKKRIA